MGTDAVDLLDRVIASPEFGPMLNRVWHGEAALRRFFFAHRETAFAHVTEGAIRFAMRCFFVGSVPTQSGGHVLTAAAETRGAQRELVARKTGLDSSDVGNRIKTALCLLVLRFVDRNAGLRALLEEGEVSWGSVARTVANTPLDLEIFEEFKSDEEWSGEGDKILRAEVQRAKGSLDGFLRSGRIVDMAAAMDTTLTLVPFYDKCRSSTVAFLKTARLDGNAYHQIINDLYLRKLISNASTTFWCTGCQDDLVVLTTHARLSPNQLNQKCPKCERPMLVATLYALAPLLEEMYFSRDGFLGVAVGWLLKSKGFAYKAGSYRGNAELDYRFTNAGKEILLECKMHKTGKDEEATTQHLVSDISQAAAHAVEIKKSGEKLHECWIVTNYELAAIDAQVRAALEKTRSKIKTHGIKLIDAGALPQKLTPDRDD